MPTSSVIFSYCFSGHLLAKNCPNIFERVLIILLEPKRGKRWRYCSEIKVNFLGVSKQHRNEEPLIAFAPKLPFFVVALVTNSRMRTRYSALLTLPSLPPLLQPSATQNRISKGCNEETWRYKQPEKKNNLLHNTVVFFLQFFLGKKWYLYVKKQHLYKNIYIAKVPFYYVTKTALLHKKQYLYKYTFCKSTVFYVKKQHLYKNIYIAKVPFYYVTKTALLHKKTVPLQMHIFVKVPFFTLKNPAPL